MRRRCAWCEGLQTVLQRIAAIHNVPSILISDEQAPIKAMDAGRLFQKGDVMAFGAIHQRARGVGAISAIGGFGVGVPGGFLHAQQHQARSGLKRSRSSLEPVH